MIIDDTIAINRLFDYYGSLLTDRQQEVFRFYYHEDYSYQEIADLLNISRAAVYDNLKRAKDSLIKYEDKLRFSSRFDDLLNALQELDIEDVDKLIEKFYSGGKYD